MMTEEKNDRKMHELRRIRESSQYFATLLRRREDLVDWLWEGRNFYRRYPLTELYQNLLRVGREAQSFGQLLLAFRGFKQQHFLRVGARDLHGLADLAETTSQLSDLASVSLQVGFDTLSNHPEWWAGGEEDLWPAVRENLRMVVMGMGKLGGHELNYVSDVDLLFLYALKNEEIPGSPERLDLLSRLCQWLSRLLSDSVEGDRVFQVDLRLRPQGKDGPLVPSLAAAADYYLNGGRAWERQVLLKARPVAGDRSLGREFLQEVRPFVFRRFLDFQALDELKAMRDRILVEAARHGIGWHQFDVKLGIGGIREIEFLVQSLQLIYGGRHPELDEPNTLRCLDRLRELRLLAADGVDELKESYTFLRRVEHWVQLDQNRQTQKLPQSEEAQRRLSLALGFGGDYGPFMARLEACCAGVHRHFLALFHSDAEGERCFLVEEAPLEGGPGTSVGFGSYTPEALSQIRGHLEVFPDALQQTVHEVLLEYSCLKDRAVAEKVLMRLDRYFGQVIKRPGLVKLFQTSASWPGDFCRGLVQGDLLSDLLACNPSLVEGVATIQTLAPDCEAWESAAMRLLGLAQDYEEGLEGLRRLKNERVLQLVLADLRGDLGYEIIEDWLSSLADFVIRNTYERICRDLKLDGNLPLCVLALGKLGSREMSYLSDLDLVFVYDPQTGESEDVIPQDVVRLTQRFMRMLSTPLHEGPGYAVDTRLRPTGNYGPLIVTRRNWLEYYSEKADLWEIQALIRLRSVAGNPALGLWVEERAREICYRKRNPVEVWQRLCHLRHRMQRERAEEKADAVDLKLGVGGLTDLEFLVQGRQLVEGYKDPGLRNSSVRSALDRVLADIPELSGSVWEIVTAFRAQRSLEHRLRLNTNQTSSRLNPVQFEAMQAVGIWPLLNEKNPIESWQDLLRLRRRSREALRTFCPEL